MSYKNLNNRDLAKFFVENTEKDAVIAAIFNHFRLYCLERSNLNPTQLDELIREFNETKDCDIEIITSIIDLIKTGQESSVNKENELVKKLLPVFWNA